VVAASQENEPGAWCQCAISPYRAAVNQPGLQRRIGAGRPFAGRDSRPEKALQLLVGADVGRQRTTQE
jgi:hypothetical protein